MDASGRKTQFWRGLLLGFCLLGAAINGWSIFTDNIEASSALGYQAALTADPALVRINSVDPGGAAERSGLRAGDLIHLREFMPGQRYRFITGVHPHEQIPVTVTRGAQTLTFIFQAGGKPVWRWDVWIWLAASFWMLGFAVLIALRRGVAGALDILAQKRPGVEDGIVLELRAMQAAIANGFAAINARLERARTAEL